jgi:hypothetical protein
MPILRFEFLKTPILIATNAQIYFLRDKNGHFVLIQIHEIQIQKITKLRLKDQFYKKY